MFTSRLTPHQVEDTSTPHIMHKYRMQPHIFFFFLPLPLLPSQSQGIHSVPLRGTLPGSRSASARSRSHPAVERHLQNKKKRKKENLNEGKKMGFRSPAPTLQAASMAPPGRPPLERTDRPKQRSEGHAVWGCKLERNVWSYPESE